MKDNLLKLNRKGVAPSIIAALNTIHIPLY
jgi:hypothetical protein